MSELKKTIKLNENNNINSEILVDSLKQCVNKMQITRTYKYDNKWFTSKLRDLQNQMHSSYKKYVFTKCTVDRLDYVQKRNYYNSEIDRSKNSFIRDELTNNLNDPKSLWKSLKKLVNSDCKPKNEYISFNDEKFTDDCVIAEKFNNYFVNSVTEIHNNIKVPHQI